VLPSLFEGLPMAVLEATFSGVPVLSSRLDGISAIMTDERDGLLASAGDVEDFSKQLKRLEDSPELGRYLAANARSNVLEQFSASVTARRIEDIYRRELGIANAKLADKSSES
jgi:colanic acid/amylovoran biosynthesis glycosyltransferase